jgi:hypothetical protein
MKKYSLMALVVLACSGPPLAAQAQRASTVQLLNKDMLLLKKEDLLLQLPLLDPTSLLLPQPGLQTQVRAQTRMTKDPRERTRELQKRCPLLKEKTAVHLEGERQSNERVGLKWVTTNGRNNRSFQVERSLGDTSHFYSVNFVWANGIQKIREKYRLPDDNDFMGVTYYRLRLTDADGRVFYSNTAAVKGYHIEQFTVFPNPAAQTAWLTWNNRQAGTASIRIYDANGRQVLQQPALTAEGAAVNKVDVSRLPPGTYLVTVRLADKTERTGKLVKE